MQLVAIDPDAIREAAAARGIDTTIELADRSGISRHVLYKAVRSGYIRPSYRLTLERLLCVEPGSFLREET